MSRLWWSVLLYSGLLLLNPGILGGSGTGLRFVISVAPAVAPGRLDGRLLLLISTDSTAEPRFQINDGAGTQLAFGIDVGGWRAGQKAVIDENAFGYPLRTLNDLPPGSYRVQALLHRYETFHRADGHVVKLPMDRGEGQRWNLAPGNLYSAPTTFRLDAPRSGELQILLDKKIPEIDPPPETRYVKHVTIQSDRLSRFWGRPMFLGAHVLLPEGYEQHPDARYPLLVFHGHFPYTFGGFREIPPDPNLPPDSSARFRITGYNRTQQEYAYSFFKEWTGPDFPRFVIIELQHANPYYDDSYAVNSANLGPYGDAIMSELIPFIEKKFRCIGEGWARFTYGGSTGGWEALAAQIFYPDDFNGCFAACPDPVDFRAYTIVNIYDHRNAYYYDSEWKKIPRPGFRNYRGEVTSTLEQANHYELVLGTHGRSGEQWDIWQAVFSPVGSDGYPAPIWDKLTGEINRDVASYWREHYDLRHILERDWATLGPKLVGKIHLYCGDMDNFYLNNAVHHMQEFLERTRNPYFDGEVRYGDGAEHCWNGDPTRPNYLSRLRYNQMYVPAILKRIRETAPAGADTTSWKY